MFLCICTHMALLPGGCDALRWLPSPLEPGIPERAWPLSLQSWDVWQRGSDDPLAARKGDGHFFLRKEWCEGE